MNLLVAGALRHPVLFGIAVIVATVLIAWAADWFVGFAERDEPSEAAHR